MRDIQDIRLEFLRFGPTHNQLLSPLTPYMALCGADGPVSVKVPFEHDELMNRLKRLRYEIDGVPVASSQREAELRELGAAIGRMLGDIPALVSDLRLARADTSRLVNIQLKISALELGLVPFEATMAPADTSGSGTPLLLRDLTSMTREIRRGEPLKLEWNRTPKILFAFASPADLPAVPAQAHLDALRRAIDPWIKIKDTVEERVAEVRNVLTVLKNATVRSISDACQTNDYTHVHILAHGAPIAGSDNRRFGVVLAKEGDSSKGVTVDGQGLAIALKSMKSNGIAKRPPTVVTLATCDSGNASTVLTPGGSIAHELHAQDIPWVIASQFPLWMRASNIACEFLYRGLLVGDDPRWVLHELRQRLRIDLPETHDWASIVAYAAIAPDLGAQVDRFRSNQTRGKLNVKFDRMDDLVGANARADEPTKVRDRVEVKAELEKICADIRAELSAWCKEPAAQREPKEHAERLGMFAASEKRIAIVYSLFDQSASSDIIKSAYRKSRELYLQALELDAVNHWVLTQFLSVAAIPALADEAPALDKLATSYGRWWMVARQLAEWQLRSLLPLDQAWAHGTLAELDLLGVIYGGSGFDRPNSLESIVRHCRTLCELSPGDPFPSMSTQRQFRRYVRHWKRDGNGGWDDLAQAALDCLERATAS